jgi:pimeloyl-ACP methyl ester carboxylesterase
MRMHVLAAIALAAAAVTLSVEPVRTAGSGKLLPIACPQQAWEYPDPTFDALPGARAFFGKYDGGLYRIEIPDHWNGELMLSAHGFVSNGGAQGSRLRVGTPAIREHLVAEGIAWAASSYRCNGYVPGIGLEDTMKLTGLFTSLNDGHAPTRVYLTGTSMGGHVTLLGMHEFPTMFAGGLAMCPAGPELFDYFTAVGAAAEAVTGLQFSTPDGTGDVVRQMAGILGRPPNLTEKGRQLADIEIQLSGGPRPFVVEGLRTRFIENISGGALAGATSPSSRAATNQQYEYTIDPGLGLTGTHLRELVRRKAPDMSMRGVDSPYEELVPFDGRIQRPLLTMHGTGDMFVPIHLERTLRRAVAAAKHEDLLVQRIYRIAGHCGFSVDEQRQSFDDLVHWVRDGAMPNGDDIFADLRDAGHTFTSPLREHDPGTSNVAPITTAEP